MTHGVNFLSRKMRNLISKYGRYGFFALYILPCVYYAIDVSRGGNEWQAGDWLINYSAGAVRRGLIGTVILMISDMGFPLLWVLYSIQVIIFLLIVNNVLALYHQRARGLFWQLILFSPVFLLFSLYDRQGGFRKEIIVFAIFSCLCRFYAEKSIDLKRALYIALAYAVSALSHELTVFVLPFFLYVIFLSAREGLITFRSASMVSLVYILTSVLVLAFTLVYRGGSMVADGVCLSIVTRNLDHSLCGGAILALDQDATKISSLIIQELGFESLWVPAVLIISISPLFFTTLWGWEMALLVAVGFVTMLPLFLVGIDWGRWIYILVFMTFCVALAKVGSAKFRRRGVFILLGIAYVSTWSVRHCCVSNSVGTGLLGYLNLL